MAARGPALAVVCARGYHEAVHDHFNPRNVGSLDKDEAGVGTALVGKASCGDVFKLQMTVEGGVFSDAKSKTFGCGSAIASSSLATAMVIGSPHASFSGGPARPDLSSLAPWPQRAGLTAARSLSPATARLLPGRSSHVGRRPSLPRRTCGLGLSPRYDS